MFLEDVGQTSRNGPAETADEPEQANLRQLSVVASVGSESVPPDETSDASEIELKTNTD